MEQGCHLRAPRMDSSLWVSGVPKTPAVNNACLSSVPATVIRLFANGRGSNLDSSVVVDGPAITSTLFLSAWSRVAEQNSNGALLHQHCSSDGSQSNGVSNKVIQFGSSAGAYIARRALRRKVVCQPNRFASSTRTGIMGILKLIGTAFSRKLHEMLDSTAAFFDWSMCRAVSWARKGNTYANMTQRIGTLGHGIKQAKALIRNRAHGWTSPHARKMEVKSIVGRRVVIASAGILLGLCIGYGMYLAGSAVKERIHRYNVRQGKKVERQPRASKKSAPRHTVQIVSVDEEGNALGISTRTSDSTSRFSHAVKSFLVALCTRASSKPTKESVTGLETRARMAHVIRSCMKLLGGFRSAFLSALPGLRLRVQSGIIQANHWIRTELVPAFKQVLGTCASYFTMTKRGVARLNKAYEEKAASMVRYIMTKETAAGLLLADIKGEVTLDTTTRNMLQAILRAKTTRSERLVLWIASQIRRTRGLLLYCLKLFGLASAVIIPVIGAYMAYSVYSEHKNLRIDLDAVRNGNGVVHGIFDVRTMVFPPRDRCISNVHYIVGSGATVAVLCTVRKTSVLYHAVSDALKRVHDAPISAIRSARGSIELYSGRVRDAWNRHAVIINRCYKDASSKPIAWYSVVSEETAMFVRDGKAVLSGAWSILAALTDVLRTRLNTYSTRQCSSRGQTGIAGVLLGTILLIASFFAPHILRPLIRFSAFSYAFSGLVSTVAEAVLLIAFKQCEYSRVWMFVAESGLLLLRKFGSIAKFVSAQRRGLVKFANTSRPTDAGKTAMAANVIAQILCVALGPLADEMDAYSRALEERDLAGAVACATQAFFAVHEGAILALTMILTQASSGVFGKTEMAYKIDTFTDDAGIKHVVTHQVMHTYGGAINLSKMLGQKDRNAGVMDRLLEGTPSTDMPRLIEDRHEPDGSKNGTSGGHGLNDHNRFSVLDVEDVEPSDDGDIDVDDEETVHKVARMLASGEAITSSHILRGTPTLRFKEWNTTPEADQPPRPWSSGAETSKLAEQLRGDHGDVKSIEQGKEKLLADTLRRSRTFAIDLDHAYVDTSIPDTVLMCVDGDLKLKRRLFSNLLDRGWGIEPVNNLRVIYSELDCEPGKAMSLLNAVRATKLEARFELFSPVETIDDWLFLTASEKEPKKAQDVDYRAIDFFPWPIGATTPCGADSATFLAIAHFIGSKLASSRLKLRWRLVGSLISVFSRARLIYDAALLVIDRWLGTSATMKNAENASLQMPPANATVVIKRISQAPGSIWWPFEAYWVRPQSPIAIIQPAGKYQSEVDTPWASEQFSPSSPGAVVPCTRGSYGYVSGHKESFITVRHCLVGDTMATSDPDFITSVVRSNVLTSSIKESSSGIKLVHYRKHPLTKGDGLYLPCKAGSVARLIGTVVASDIVSPAISGEGLYGLTVMSMLSIDARGLSGSPIVDSEGKCVGVVSSSLDAMSPFASLLDLCCWPRDRLMVVVLGCVGYQFQRDLNAKAQMSTALDKDVATIVLLAPRKMPKATVKKTMVNEAVQTDNGEGTQRVDQDHSAKGQPLSQPPIEPTTKTAAAKETGPSTQVHSTQIPVSNFDEGVEWKVSATHAAAATTWSAMAKITASLLRSMKWTRAWRCRVLDSKMVNMWIRWFKFLTPTWVVNLTGRRCDYSFYGYNDIHNRTKSADYIHAKVADVSSSARAAWMLRKIESVGDMSDVVLSIREIKTAMARTNEVESMVSDTVFPEILANRTRERDIESADSGAPPNSEDLAAEEMTMPGSMPGEPVIRKFSGTTILSLAKEVFKLNGQNSLVPKSTMTFACRVARDDIGVPVLVARDDVVEALSTHIRAILDRQPNKREIDLVAERMLGLRQRSLDREIPSRDPAAIAASGHFQISAELMAREVIAAKDRRSRDQYLDTSGALKVLDLSTAGPTDPVRVAYLLAAHCISSDVKFDVIVDMIPPIAKRAEIDIAERAPTSLSLAMSILYSMYDAMMHMPAGTELIDMVQESMLIALQIEHRAETYNDAATKIWTRLIHGRTISNSIAEAMRGKHATYVPASRAHVLKRLLNDLRTWPAQLLAMVTARISVWTTGRIGTVVDGVEKVLLQKIASLLIAVTRIVPVIGRFIDKDELEKAFQSNKLQTSQSSLSLVVKASTFKTRVVCTILDSIAMSALLGHQVISVDTIYFALPLLAVDVCVAIYTAISPPERSTVEGKAEKVVNNTLANLAKTYLAVSHYIRLANINPIDIDDAISKVVSIGVLLTNDPTVMRLTKQAFRFVTDTIDHVVGRKRKAVYKSRVKRMFSHVAIVCNPAHAIVCCLITCMHAAFVLDYKMATSFYAAFSTHRSLANLQKSRAEAAKNSIIGFVSFNKLGNAIAEAARGHPNVIQTNAADTIAKFVSTAVATTVGFKLAQMFATYQFARAAYNWFVDVMNADAIRAHAHEVNPKFGDAMKMREKAKQLYIDSLPYLCMVVPVLKEITRAYVHSGTGIAMGALVLGLIAAHVSTKMSNRIKFSSIAALSATLGSPGNCLLCIAAYVTTLDSAVLFYTLGVPVAVLASQQSEATDLRTLVSQRMHEAEMGLTDNSCLLSTGNFNDLVHVVWEPLIQVSRTDVFEEHETLSSEWCKLVCSVASAGTSEVEKVVEERRELRRVIKEKDTKCEAGDVANEILSARKYYASDSDLTGKFAIRKLAILDGFSATMMHGFEPMRVEDAYFDVQAIKRLRLGDAAEQTGDNPFQQELVDPNDVKGKSPVGTYLQLLLSTRNRSQGARGAIEAWQKFVKEEKESMKNAIISITAVLKSLGVRSKKLSKSETPLLFVDAKRSTPGIITSYMTGLRTMKDFHHYLLDTETPISAARLGTGQLFNSFGKREVLFAKGPKETVGVIKKMGDPTSDVRIRMIQTVEGPERIASFQSEIWMNNGILLSRLKIPVKKGLKIAGEWPLLVSSMLTFKWVVTIDIDNYDGNQHRGMSHMQCLVRAGLAVDKEAVSSTLAHTCSVSHRLTLNRYGLVTEVMGTMPSGDVNTTDDNSLRSWIALEAASLMCGYVRGTDCDYGLSGDNIFIACDDLKVMENIRECVTRMGWPSRFDGIVNTRQLLSPIVMPEFLGMIGVRFRIFARTVLGDSVEIKGTCAWRTPGRILPKLVGFNDRLSPKLMRQRVKQKAMMWLYTWPLDGHMAEAVNRLGASINDLVQSKYNASRNRAGARHAAGMEETREHSGKESPTEDKIHAGWDWWVSKHIGLPNLIDEITSVEFVDHVGNDTPAGAITGPLARGTVQESMRSKEDGAKPVAKYLTNCKAISTLCEEVPNVTVEFKDTRDVLVGHTGRYDATIKCTCDRKETPGPAWSCVKIRELMSGTDISM